MTQPSTPETAETLSADLRDRSSVIDCPDYRDTYTAGLMRSAADLLDQQAREIATLREERDKTEAMLDECGQFRQALAAILAAMRQDNTNGIVRGWADQIEKALNECP